MIKRAGANKFNARKTSCNHGHRHDSGKEARHCNDLHVLERAGVITHLEIHPKYYFHIDGVPVMHLNGRRAVFTPDFRFREKNGQLVCEDSKGVLTEAYQLRAAFFRAIYRDTVLREV